MPSAAGATDRNQRQTPPPRRTEAAAIRIRATTRPLDAGSVGLTKVTASVNAPKAP
jgi:hypothetical protein